MNTLRRFYLRIDHGLYRLHGRASLPELTFLRLRAMREGIADGVVVDGVRETVAPATRRRRRGGPPGPNRAAGS